MARDASQARLTLREADAETVLPLLAPVAQYDTTGGVDSLERMAANGRAFVIEQDGAPVCAYLLERHGREAFVTAAAGAAGVCLTDLLAQLIEAQAIGLDSIAFQTRRRGLIRKAIAKGYRVAGHVTNGTIMRKELQ
ncbi:hypothetical protein [Burkholderia cepacia]|uniref:hypothetical protein n=1 Tax=Burkholderia cepacia TaxID=292 RepID=UPI000753B93C|nr:hypothetical protein [Burkholderia cepacia]KWH51809.1 hypothetical protein WM00_02610 [Burkholderia cepacia]